MSDRRFSGRRRGGMRFRPERGLQAHPHSPAVERAAQEARAAAEMLLGTAVALVVAGLVEGFVTPSGQSLGTVLVIGFGLGIAYWAAVLVLGRRALRVAPAT